MSDPTDSFEQLQAAIERLDIDAQYRLKQWFFCQSLIDDEEPDRVAEAVPKYASSYLSVEEFLKLETESDIRYEYVDGQMYAMSGASLRHKLICTNLSGALGAHLRGGPCRAFQEGVKVLARSSERSFIYYPDLVVVCGKLDQKATHLEEPRLIVEVASPSTARVDREEKARNYQLIPSLEEYIMVAQHQCKVTVLRRSHQWRPTTLEVPDGTLALDSISLSLPVAQIYEEVEW